MKNYKIIITVQILFLFISPAVLLKADERNLQGGEGFTLFYVDRFPYHYMKDGTIRGLIGEAADYAFRKSGFAYKWQETPAIRMMVLVKENSEKVVMAGWFKNPEREKIGKFSIPVYQDKSHMIIARKGNEKIRKIKSLAALLADKNLTLLVKDGYSYGKVFDTMIKKNQTQVHKVTVDMVKMIQMINAGRGDYMLATQEEGEYLIKSSGVPREGIVLKGYPDSPEGEYRYLLFSKKVSDREIKIINSYIREYRKSRSDK